MVRSAKPGRVGGDGTLTLEEAARALNVSREYLLRLLRAGDIPSRKAGARRVLRATNVLGYKRKRDDRRRRGLRELSELTQRFGGYNAEK